MLGHLPKTVAKNFLQDRLLSPLFIVLPWPSRTFMLKLKKKRYSFEIIKKIIKCITVIVHYCYAFIFYFCSVTPQNKQIAATTIAKSVAQKYASGCIVR